MTTIGPIRTRMSKFPTRDSWFDVAWPCAGEVFSKDSEKRILVPVARHTDFKEVEEAVDLQPNCIFMLLVEDFDLFNERMPDRWRRMPPDGGIPPNVWVGASFKTQEELDSRAPRLRKIRARKLFLYGRADREPIDIELELIPWRCMNCGRRGDVKVPVDCPTGSLCAIENKIEPQIHWVIDMLPQDDDPTQHYFSECSTWKVALWDYGSKEVPE